ncbi:MAG: peptidyl-prolyl cis-trans isomerase, partial [Eudoraea sp.]|nr:peptidyl-prolyl cis-trans isomerase [Eudoraea sp.]
MIKKLSKEPLVHFIAAGIVLFLMYGFFGNDDAEKGKVLHISKGQIDLMHSHWTRQLGRPPTQEERQGLIDDDIKEEILMQEALTMGLD